MTNCKEYTISKTWIKDMLGSRFPKHDNGDLKFPKYLYICSCGDIDCDNRRTGKAGLYGPANLDSSIDSHYRHEHGYWNPMRANSQVYVREEEVLLKRGQARNLSYEEKRELRRLLK